jgi:hypothetical protein
MVFDETPPETMSKEAVLEYQHIKPFLGIIEKQDREISELKVRIKELESLINQPEAKEDFYKISNEPKGSDEKNKPI